MCPYTAPFVTIRIPRSRRGASGGGAPRGTLGDMERSSPSRWQVIDDPGWGPADPDADPGRAGRDGRGVPRARTLAVVGATGGCGASSLAAACAVAARAAGRAALVDLDTCGGGLDVLLGVEDVVGARWPDLHAARGHVDPDELVASLPRWRGVPVLSADRRRPAPVADDVRDAVLAGLRARAVTVVLDVPRSEVSGAWGSSGVSGLPGALGASAADAVALLVPVHVAALAGAVAVTVAGGVAGPVAGSSGASSGGPSGGPSGAAAGSGGPADPRTPDAEDDNPPWVVVARGRPRGRLHPDDLGAALGLPVAGRLRDDRRTAGSVERGDGPRVGRGTALRAAADATLAALAGTRQ